MYPASSYTASAFNSVEKVPSSPLVLISNERTKWDLCSRCIVDSVYMSAVTKRNQDWGGISFGLSCFPTQQLIDAADMDVSLNDDHHPSARRRPLEGVYMVEQPRRAWAGNIKRHAHLHVWMRGNKATSKQACATIHAICNLQHRTTHIHCRCDALLDPPVLRQ